MPIYIVATGKDDEKSVCHVVSNFSECPMSVEHYPEARTIRPMMTMLLPCSCGTAQLFGLCASHCYKRALHSKSSLVWKWGTLGGNEVRYRGNGTYAPLRYEREPRRNAGLVGCYV